MTVDEAAGSSVVGELVDGAASELSPTTDLILPEESVLDGDQASVSDDPDSRRRNVVEPVPDASIDINSRESNCLPNVMSDVSDHTEMCLSSEPCTDVDDNEAGVDQMMTVTEENGVEAGPQSLGLDSEHSNISLENGSSLASSICLDAVQDDNAAVIQIMQRKESAALCIQSAYRRYTARKALTAWQRSVEVLNRLAVGYLYSTKFHIVRGAAITLQAAIRRHVCRQHFLSLRAAVVRIQAAYRGRVCHCHYQAVRSAVTSVQALTRGHLVRKRMLLMRLLREQAAVCLQAAFRGHHQRQRYRRAVAVAVSLGLLSTKPASSELLQCVLSSTQSGMPRDSVIEATHNLAATKIQTAFAAWRYRRRCAAVITCQRTLRALPYRVHFSNVRLAAVTIQSRWRATRLTKIARENLLNHIGAAIVIQSVVKTFLCRSRYLRIRHAVIAMQRKYRKRKQLAFNHSATVIQSAVRMFLLRSKFLKARRAAVLIQAVYRCEVQRVQFKLMRTSAVMIQRWWHRRMQLRWCKAATKIQSFMRMVSVRRQYRGTVRKVVIVQSLVRSFLTRLRFVLTRESAVSIQRCWRRHVLLREARVRRSIMLGAAIAIQAAFRGYLERKAYKTKQMQHWTAVNIQRIFRGYCTRQYYTKQRSVIVLLQAACRAAIVRMQLRRRANAAMVIQRAMRVMLAQREYQRMQRCIAAIQSACRGYLVRQELRRRQKAAVVIQKIYQGFVARCQFRRDYQSVVCLQAHVRGLQVRRGLQEKRTAATALQSVFRGYQARQFYSKQLTGILHLQRICRSYLAERHFARQQSAAVAIQKMVRGMSARKQYARQQNLVVFMQACVRHHLAVQKLNAMRQSCVVVQKWWRNMLLIRSVRRQFLVSVGAAVTLQAAIRRFIARKRFVVVRHASVTIQAVLRMWKTRAAFQQLRSAAVLVQRRYRAKVAGREQRQLYVEMCHSALVLQQRFRARRIGRVHRQRYQELRSAAVIVQQRFRARLIGRVQRQRYQELRSAVVVIQQKFRARRFGQHQRRCYRMLRHATLVIQRSYRAYVIGHRQKSDYVQLRRSAIVLQRQYRARSAGRLQRCRYEKLRCAAVTIQRWFRAHIVAQAARLQYRKLYSAVLLVQRMRRRRLAARYTLHRERAAIKIQSAVRMHIAQSKYHTTRKHVILLQNIIRWRLCRQRFVQIHSSAVVVQRFWRQIMNQRRQNKAAVCIQAAFRRHMAATGYHKMKTCVITMQRFARTMLVKKHMAEAQKSAAVIQCWYHAVITGRKQRLRYIQLRNAVTSIQRAVRRAAANRLQRKTVSAVKIQSWYRMTCVRRSYVSQRAAVLKLQSVARCYLQQRWMRRQSLAALLIQRWWFSSKLTIQKRNRFIELRRSAVIIQAAFRRYLAQRRYLAMSNGFRRLAAVFRRLQHQRRYLKLRASVTYIGRWYRCRIAARNFALMLQLRRSHAARVIQTHIRKYVDRVKCDREEREMIRLKQAAAAVVIQRTFSTYMQRKRYLRHCHQVVIVQATARRWLACRHVARLKAQLIKSAVCLQAHARGFLCRKRIKVRSITLHFCDLVFFWISCICSLCVTLCCY